MAPVLTLLPVFGTSPLALGILVALGVIALALAVRLSGAARWVVGSSGALAVVLGALAWTERGVGPDGARVVTSYGVALAVAVAGAGLWAEARARREGLPPRVMAGIFVWVLFGALLGARLVDAGFRSGTAPGAGLSGFGALAGGSLGAWLGSHRAKWPFARVADCLAAPLAVAAVVINVGCYLHGCHVGQLLGAGAPAFLERLGTFPRWSSTALGFGPPVLSAQIAAGQVPPGAEQSLPAHPLNLYGTSLAIAALALLWRLHRRGRLPVGREALLVVALVAGGRLVLEISFGGT